MLPAPLLPWVAALDLDDDDFESNSRTWWLARSQDCSRLLLVYTHGVMDIYSALAYDTVVHCGRTIRSYASGYTCIVFSKDTS